MVVAFVHGLWDKPACFRRLQARLQKEGLGSFETPRLPMHGFTPIEPMAGDLVRIFEGLARSKGPVDVVAFSMGALVTRFCIQELGAHRYLRRFVSISGPHHGSYMAHLVPGAGAAQLRPASPFLRRLHHMEGQWHGVEVHNLWTPFDLSVLPSRSSALRGVASERRFPVLAHRLMLHNARVAAHVAACLRG